MPDARTLVLQRLLAEQGVVAELRIGVHKEGKQFGAHAWLEYAGEPIHETNAVTGGFATGCGGD